MKKGQRARRLEVPYGTDHSTNWSGSRVPLELGEPRASGEGEAWGDGSRAGSAGFAGQGLKGPQSVAGIAK